MTQHWTKTLVHIVASPFFLEGNKVVPRIDDAKPKRWKPEICPFIHPLQSDLNCIRFFLDSIKQIRSNNHCQFVRSTSAHDEEASLQSLPPSRMMKTALQIARYGTGCFFLFVHHVLDAARWPLDMFLLYSWVIMLSALLPKKL